MTMVLGIPCNLMISLLNSSTIVLAENKCFNGRKCPYLQNLLNAHGSAWHHRMVGGASKDEGGLLHLSLDTYGQKAETLSTEKLKDKQ